MTTDWYYARGTVKNGPVSSAHLKQLAITGALLPTDLVWKEGMAKWMLARSVKNLFQTEPPIAASAKPPPLCNRPPDTSSAMDTSLPQPPLQNPAPNPTEAQRVAPKKHAARRIVYSIVAASILFALGTVIAWPHVDSWVTKKRTTDEFQAVALVEPVDYSEKPLTGDQIYRQLLKSTVWVITPDGIGSGALVHDEEKLVLTNYHVVGAHRQVAVCFPSYRKEELISDPQYYMTSIKETGISGTVIAKDAGHDLAIIQLKSVPPGGRVLRLARQSPKPGENIHSIGASGVEPPKGKSKSLGGALWRYTSGQVRQVYERDDDLGDFRLNSTVVETNAPINPGDSGGPVVNDRGMMVAVVSNYKIKARSVSNNIDVREVRAFLRKHLQSVGRELDEGGPSPVASKADLMALTRTLQGGSGQQRVKALDVVAGMGEDAQTAIPHIMPLLADGDADVQRAAARALERTGLPSENDADVVLAALNDDNPNVRRFAARVLVKMEVRTSNALTAWLKAAKDKETEVRQQACVALGKLGTGYREKVLPILLETLADADADVRQKALDGLVHLNPNSEMDLRILSDGIKHTNPTVRMVAVTSLGHGTISPQAIALLLSARKDADLKVRELAVEALGKCATEEKLLVFPALSESLTDSERSIRKRAMSSLQKLGAPTARDVPQLVQYLKHEYPEVRSYAVNALNRLGVEAEAAATNLATALRDGEKQIAYQAAEAIGNIGPKARIAAPSLIDALKSPDAEFRGRIASALGKIGRDDTSALRTLITCLDDDDDVVRQNALKALRNFSPLDKNALDSLSSALKSKRPLVRGYAVAELAKIGSEAAVLIKEALADTESTVRMAAIAALGDLKASVAVPDLVNTLRSHRDATSRIEVMIALGKIGPEATDAVTAIGECLDDKNAEIRTHAANSLGAIGPEAKAAISKLVVALEHRDSLEDVSDALSKIGKLAVPALSAVLTDKRPVVRLGAVLALGKIGPDARPAYARIAWLSREDRNHPEIRDAALSAMNRINQKE